VGRQSIAVAAGAFWRSLQRQIFVALLSGLRWQIGFSSLSSVHRFSFVEAANPIVNVAPEHVSACDVTEAQSNKPLGSVYTDSERELIVPHDIEQELVGFACGVIHWARLLLTEEPVVQFQNLFLKK
jgi:hypothetical protein